MGKRIGILNGGGDCAGLNAVIAAVVKAGLPQGYEFVGIMRGFEGLLEGGKTMPLGLNEVKDIASLGGTIIFTTNQGRFAAKVGSGETNQIPMEILQEAKASVDRLGLDSLIVIGGDGTLTGAMQLQELGVKMVGVPKTIDNDLLVTERTFGFSTAVAMVSEALDRIRTTAASHNRVIIVETMGRHSGWIALHGGIAGNADMILIPEIEFTYDSVVAALRKQKTEGENYSIIVIAEGATPKGEELFKLAEGADKEFLLGGVAGKLKAEIQQRAKDEFEMRTLVLGHLQRGGSPTAEDRVLAQRYGTAAMELTVKEKFGYMPALQGDKIVSIEIQQAVAQLKKVEPDSEVVKVARDLGIYFGD